MYLRFSLITVIAAFSQLCNFGCGHRSVCVAQVLLPHKPTRPAEDPCQGLTVPEMRDSPRLNSAWPIPLQLQALDCRYNRTGSKRRLRVVLELVGQSQQTMLPFQQIGLAAPTICRSIGYEECSI